MKPRWKQYSHFERLQLLELYDQNDKELTMEQFCELHEISKWTLIQWIRDRKNKTGVFEKRIDKLPEGAKPEKPLFFTHSADKVVVDQDKERIIENERNTVREIKREDSTPRNLLLRRGSWVIEIPAEFDADELKRLLTVISEVET